MHSRNAKVRYMVDVAQLAEHQIVVLGVVGSSPIFHPSRDTGCGIPFFAAFTALLHVVLRISMDGK